VTQATVIRGPRLQLQLQVDERVPWEKIDSHKYHFPFPISISIILILITSSPHHLINSARNMSPPLSDHCIPLDHPHWFPVTLASGLVVGILVSYLPQHYKIFTRRTSEGISPWWVLLGGLSSIAAIGNILTLPTSRADMACCDELSGGACAAALLGVAQIGVQWTCFMGIILLYIVFYPRTEHEIEDLSASTGSLTKNSTANNPRDPLLVGACIFVSLFAVALISISLVFRWPSHTQIWADLLGTISGLLAAVQYIPQIYYTWVMGDLKSLSILTLLIQAPGAFVFAFSLYLRVGAEGWSTWLVYIVTGLLQFVLLGMAANYWSKKRLEKVGT
jgi:uncharacterized protein with PQ loop repeat